MVFASNTFIFLFLPVFLIVYSLTPAAFRNHVLLAFSWLFYAWWRVDHLPLLPAIAAWSWSTGFWIHRSDGNARRFALLIGILGPLLALGWFKYANLMVDSARMLGAAITSWQDVALPIALSFFVFGAISYSVDVYRRHVQPEPNFINYATYQSMFGHLVAGPIVRYAWVAERIKSRVFDRSEFLTGAERFMLGFAQKVLLADTLAPVVDAAYALSAPTTVDVMVGVVAYTLQLYFDFAGYSHMAIGLGLMVGLRFPENFRTPYLACSLQDFWQRWHISLSSWLRDYLYFPLGGNRSGAARIGVNLLITMGLGGIWHGASWTFLAWGIWHALGLVASRLWRAATMPELPAWLGHLLTLAFVMLGWLLFRAQDWSTFGTMAQGLAGLNGVGMSDAFRAVLRPVELAAMIVGVLVIYAPLSRHMWEPADAIGRTITMGTAFPLWLTAVWVLQGRSVIPFLYFQF